MTHFTKESILRSQDDLIRSVDRLYRDLLTPASMTEYRREFVSIAETAPSLWMSTMFELIVELRGLYNERAMTHEPEDRVMFDERFEHEANHG